jgi:hypothetical protein
VVSRWRPVSGRQAIAVGLIWLVMTVAFEFVFGHYVAGHSWERLLYDYDLPAGRLWSLVLAWIALARGHPIHARLSALQTGDRLQIRADGERVLLCDGEGFAVARLSKRGSAEWLPKLSQIEGAKIVALLHRRREDNDPALRDHFRADTWEVLLAERRAGG